MKIAVRYMAQLKQAAGTAGEEIDLPAACSAVALLASLVERHGEALRRLVLTGDGRAQPTLLVFVDDEQAPESGDLPLRDRSTVTLLSPIAGG